MLFYYQCDECKQTKVVIAQTQNQADVQMEMSGWEMNDVTGEKVCSACL